MEEYRVYKDNIEVSNYGNISKCCQGKISRTGMYKWSYLIVKKVQS